MTGDGAALAARAIAVYTRIAETTMRDVPICHPLLGVEATAFRRCGDAWIGVLTTPWFMNLVAFPAEPGGFDALAVGTTRPRRLPCGEIDFTLTDLDGLGRFDYCSLFSPMSQFADRAAAQGAAAGALEAVFTAPAPEVPSRRAFWRAPAGPSA